MFVTYAALRSSAGHPFYEALEKILKAQGFDRYAEVLCEGFYNAGGRPSIPPGVRRIRGGAEVPAPHAEPDVPPPREGAPFENRSSFHREPACSAGRPTGCWTKPPRGSEEALDVLAPSR